LSTSAFHGMRREVQDGLIDTEEIESPERLPVLFSEMDESHFSFAAEEGDVIVLGANDLRLFAENYASPDELDGIRQHPKFCALVALIKNTPERIKEVQDTIADLRRPANQ